MRCTREELKEAFKRCTGVYSVGSNAVIDIDVLRDAMDQLVDRLGDVVKNTKHYELLLEAYQELYMNNKITFKGERTNKEKSMKESTITVKPLTESTFKPVEITLQINNEQDMLALLATLLPSVDEVEESVEGYVSLSVSQKKALMDGNRNSNIPYQLFSDLEDIYPLADL